MSKEKAAAGPALRARTEATAGRPTKKKVSLTVDETILEGVRALAGDRGLSAAVNDLLADALAQRKLNTLVDEMESQAGPAPAEVYAQILEEWDRGANG